MTRANALYARFSSDLQNPSSATDQLARLREYLARAGERAELEYSDEGVSGSVWDARPGVQALIDAIKARKVSTVYAESLDRISRDSGDLHRFRKLLKHYGSDFVSISDGMKLDSSSGAAMLFMMKSFTAEQSVRDTADKSQRGLRANATQGRTTGGKTYGYARVRVGESRKGTAIRQNEIDPDQAKVVRRIFELYDQGLGYGAIASALNGDDIPPPRGPQKRSNGVGGWMSSCVREMLRNPKYVGEWRFGVREWGRHPDTERRVVRKRRDASNPTDKERLVEQVFPKLAIVDRRLWDRVQARLGEHLGRYKRREISDRKSSYLLSGLVRCAVCGSRMQIYGGAVPRYRCSANTKRGVCTNTLSVRERELREGIVKAIAEHMSAPSTLALMKRRVAEHLRRQVEQRDASMASARRERSAAAARVTKNEERLKRAHVRQLDGDSDHVLDALVRELRAEVQADRAKLYALQAADAADAKGPSAQELDELSKYVCGLSYLNELDQEFADAKPVEVRVGEMRESLRTLLRGGAIRLEPDATGRAYIAQGVLLPLALLGATPTPGGAGRAYDNRSCAGLYHPMYHAIKQPLRMALVRSAPMEA